MNNKILEMQEMLMRELKRLDDDNHMKENNSNEVARSNAITNGVNTFLKTININIRVMEMSEKLAISNKELSKGLGIEK